MALRVLSIDLQNEFATEGGVHYYPRPSVAFIRNTFLPFVRERGYTIAEIISDYRVPEAGNSTSVCVPGQWGYQSIIPVTLKHLHVWVKAGPSPIWIREGGGHEEQPPGVPYPAPDAFSAWLSTTIGSPTADHQIIVIGLTLEICVLSTLQELYYHGYPAKVVFEGVDTYLGNVEQKRCSARRFFRFGVGPSFGMR